MKLYLMNSTAIVRQGLYSYKHISPETARRLIRSGRFISAIGHSGTAEMLSEWSGIHVPANRINVMLERGDIALVVKIETRLPEGKVLDKNEIEALFKEGKITFGLLTRVK